MKDYGCIYGLPHNLKPDKEFKDVKYEVCILCNKRFRWNKDYKGRVDNKKYLEAHARSFAQRFGRTKQLYMKLYKPEECVIKVKI